ncbi:CLUMA_CG003932, isoform A [Clunio marinus]|uniref:CLUMA_CG003932, isoform A n=1 Tax=Clunio marinus TaxID=568069 RepID=A0A1J1HQG9_9DIPT|nr:CLUMA_CG003932, isoform A [Clunio marinus]
MKLPNQFYVLAPGLMRNVNINTEVPAFFDTKEIFISNETKQINKSANPEISSLNFICIDIQGKSVLIALKSKGF